MNRIDTFKKVELEFLNENCNYSSKNTIFLSFDIDWAPDFMLKFTADLVEGLDVSFMHTHFSEISNLINNNFPSGIHPNLQYGSDQGNNLEEVINFQKSLSVDFTTCRFHLLKYGYPDLVELSKHGTKLDSSVILFNGKNIIPTYHHDIDMIMAPYFWEDGIYLQSKRNFKGKLIDLESKGLKILDFHPLDIYLNTSSIEQRNKFKNSVTKLQKTEEKFARNFINISNEFGSRDILIDLLNRNKRGELEIKSLDSLNKEYRQVFL